MPTINEVLQQGWQLHQAGHVDRAEQHYRHVLASVAEERRRVRLSGDRSFRSTTIRGIGRCLSRGDCDSQRTFRSLGTISATRCGCWARSTKPKHVSRRHFEQQPDYLSALKNRGTLWVWSGEIERGLRWYQRGLEVDPDNAELHRNLGVIHLAAGQLRRRLGRVSLALENARNVPTVNFDPGLARRIAGRTRRSCCIPNKASAMPFILSASPTCLRNLGAKVVLQCAANLIPLFTSAPGVDQLLLDTAPLPGSRFSRLDDRSDRYSVRANRRNRCGATNCFETGPAI